MKRFALAAIAGSLLLGTAGCGKDALSAHADTVAKAGTEELSVKTLADLLGQSKVPLRKDVVRVIADLWIDYQQTVSKTWTVDASDAQARYDAGDILAARHILISVPPNSAPIQRAAIQQRADSLRRLLTVANFAENAAKFSADQGSAKQGGQLPAWPKGRNVMVPEFEAGVVGTKPGQISAPVASQFGFHIIYRPTFAEAAQLVAPVVQQLAAQRAESTYFAGLEKAADVKVKADAPKMVRDIIADIDAYTDSKMVLASVKGGDFTAAQMVRWVNAYPPEQSLQAQIANAPDTVIPNLVRNFVRNELFLRQADSAKVALTPQESEGYRKELRDFVSSSQGTLGVAPAMLPDSIRKASPEVRKQFIARRIDTFLTNMLTKDGMFVQIPRPLSQLLRARYTGAKVFDAGVDKTLEAATKARTSADSARNAAAPPSAAPVPGAPPAGGPQVPGMPPQGAAPQP
ncbi:MAG: peptidyl-prolyl cis-trans isomerase [Gemmatimonadaceae bacterium]|nr:peptidyl-prolyl cis-trans isomerase [Gemmatimonadaceae bacterium]